MLRWQAPEIASGTATSPGFPREIPYWGKARRFRDLRTQMTADSAASSAESAPSARLPRFLPLIPQCPLIPLSPSKLWPSRSVAPPGVLAGTPLASSSRIRKSGGRTESGRGGADVG